MRVTTVRVRPLRRRTIEEHDVDLAPNGPGFEFWVGGALQAIGYYPTERETVEVELVWATEWAQKHEQHVGQVLESAGYLVSDPPPNGGAE